MRTRHVLMEGVEVSSCNITSNYPHKTNTETVKQSVRTGFTNGPEGSRTRHVLMEGAPTLGHRFGRLGNQNFTPNSE